MGRVKHYWDSVGHAWKIIIGLFSLVGFFDTLQAQFFPEEIQKVIPHIYDIYMLAPWYCWAIVLLLLIAISAIESSYRQKNKAISISKIGDWDINDAVQYVANMIWHKNDRESVEKAIEAVRQRARVGDITLFGRLGRGAPISEVPPSYWDNFTFRILSESNGDSEVTSYVLSGLTTPSQGSFVEIGSPKRFEDIMAIREEVEKNMAIGICIRELKKGHALLHDPDMDGAPTRTRT